MHCRRIALPGVGFAIVCGPRPRRRACKFCGDLVDDVVLCDWKLTGTKAGKTCSAPCCRRCAASVGADKDLCPPHKRAWDTDPRNPAAAKPAPP
jgi:hypothetical protein